MSFLTSFCDFPQKLQLRVSRFSIVSSNPRARSPGCLPPAWPSLPYILLRLLLRRLLVHDDVVDQAVFLGLSGPHEVVAVGVLLDPLDGLARVLRQDLVQARLDAED